MSNYKTMYYRLFNRVSDVIEDLKQIQQETEELYMASEENELRVFQSHPGNNKEGIARDLTK